jgi:hypothetical protein
VTVIPDAPPSIEDEQPWSFGDGIPILFQDLALTREILVDKGFLEVAVQCRKGHTTAGAIDRLLLRACGIFAHEVTEFQVHPRFTQSFYRGGPSLLCHCWASYPFCRCLGRKIMSRRGGTSERSGIGEVEDDLLQRLKREAAAALL